MRERPDIAPPGTAPYRHDPRRRPPVEGACRRCFGTHWISIEAGNVGLPIRSADERAIPCERCNSDGALPHQPLTSHEDRIA